MATEPAGADGYVPLSAEFTPLDVVTTAERHGLVVECVGASGVTHSFVHAFDSLWAARCVLNSGDSRTWVVDQQREDTIENAIRRCDPDVRLVEEACSTFGGDADDA